MTELKMINNYTKVVGMTKIKTSISIEVEYEGRGSKLKILNVLDENGNDIEDWNDCGPLMEICAQDAEDEYGLAMDNKYDQMKDEGKI